MPRASLRRRHGAYSRRDLRRRLAGPTDVSRLVTRFERGARPDYFDGRVRALIGGTRGVPPFTDAEIAAAVTFEHWAADLDDSDPQWNRFFLFARSGYIVAARDYDGQRSRREGLRQREDDTRSLDA